MKTLFATSYFRPNQSFRDNDYSSFIPLLSSFIAHRLSFINLLSCFLLFIFATSLSAQTSISGIINHYAKVSAVDTCYNRLSVSSASNFPKGTKLLLVQMKGASIAEADNSSYGDINALNNTGKSERNEVDSIVGNDLYLKYKLLNTYTISGLVQIVDILTYNDALVTNTLLPKPWDGQTGGIIAFEVQNQLTLNAAIDASAKGFRGGKSFAVGSNSCSWVLNNSNYTYASGNWRAAEKGEGITEITVGKELGRGAQATGGGGGNDHNAGGGGGANQTKGGLGGRNDEPSTFGCQGNNPGVGGKTNASSTGRIFLGGGGGAGHSNNDVGSNGGLGGGIIYIKTNVLNPKNQKIISNGETPKTTAGGDGAGGGGAGGTIVLDLKSTITAPLLEAKGGAGGTVNNNDISRCFGPGGGASGGAIYCNFTTNNDVLIGGDAGKSLTGACGANNNNGALKGADGLRVSQIPIQQGDIKANTLKINQQLPAQTQGCIGDDISLTIGAQGTNAKYQWQVSTNGGSTFSNLNNTLASLGATTQTVVLGEVSAVQNGNLYRCVVTVACMGTVTSQATTLSLLPKPNAGFTVQTVGLQSIFSNISMNAVSYSWSFGDGSMSAQTSPLHTYSKDGTYTVTMIAKGDCGETTVTDVVVIVTPPKAAFATSGREGCLPFTVQFFDQSTANTTGLKWSFGGGTPSVSTEKNPIVVYNQVGQFDVTLLATNSQFQDEVAQKDYIVVKDKPTASYLTNIKLTDVTFTNTSKNADSYAWSFGDGTTSIDPNPKHTYDKDSAYQVILTVSNECGQRSDTQSVVIVTPPKADFEQNVVLGCAPLSVQFKQKASYNAKKFAWQFEGGTPATSNAPNPSVVFEKGGKFNVQLTVSNDAGQDQKSKPSLITVKDKPQIAFDATLFKRKATFANTTQNALSYSWDFGDNSPKVTDATPTHDYAKSSTYTVTLSAKNECGTATLSKEITVANLVNCDELVWKLYPNPADVETLMEFNGDLLQAMPYQIFTIDGRLFREGIFEKETGDQAFDVTTWADGLYIVYFECGERRFVRKLVVTKR